MFNSLMMVLVVLGLALGGTSAGVYAAQDSLPDQALYPLKTLSEEARIRLTTQAQEQVRLLLQFSERRVREMASLAQADEPIPLQTTTRHAAQIEYALRLAAGMPEEEALPTLERIRAQLQNQEQMLAQIAGGTGPADAVLERVRTRLREQIRLAEMGEADQQALREQLRLRDRERQRLSTHTPAPAFGTQGPHASQTPMPLGTSYGPGPLGASQTPGTTGGYGPGPSASQPAVTPQGNQYHGSTAEPGGGSGTNGGGQPPEPGGVGEPSTEPGGGGEPPAEPPGSGGETGGGGTDESPGPGNGGGPGGGGGHP
jgi:hypothetical protein